MALGITQAGYSGLERGRSPFTIPQLNKVAKGLGISASDLLQQADGTATALRAQGIEVLGSRPTGDGSNKWAWIAGGVIAVAAAAVVGAVVANELDKDKRRRRR